MTNTLNKIIHNGDEYLIPSGEVGVSDQANNIFTPWMKIWGWTESDYQSLTPDSNTAYLLLANQPTPPSPRQPWVNTLAYYHIEADDDTTIHDRAGNNDLSYLSNAYITDADAGKVLDFASQNYASWNVINMWTEYTEIAWVYWNWGWWSSQAIFTQNASSSRRPSTWIYIEDWNLVAISNQNISSNIPMPQWAWTMICWTRNSNWDMKLYLNWVYQTTVSNTSTPDYSSWEWLYLGLWRLPYYQVDWYFKTLILEDKERDASEVSSYYNQTKWDFWIS